MSDEPGMEPPGQPTSPSDQPHESPGSQTGSMISEAGREEVLALARQHGVTLLLVQVAGQRYMLFFPGEPSLREFDLDSSSVEDLITCLSSYDQAVVSSQLLGLAHKFVGEAIDARRGGDLQQAWLRYRFALSVACLYDDLDGMLIVSHNLWLVRDNLRELVRVNVTPPYPDGPSTATLSTLYFLAGDILMAGAEGGDEREQAVLTILAIIKRDCADLYSFVQQFSDRLDAPISSEEGMLRLLVAHRLAILAEEEEAHRALLVRLSTLTSQSGRHDLTLQGLLTEIGELNEYQIFVEMLGAKPALNEESQETQMEKTALGLNALWDLFLHERQYLSNYSGQHEIIDLYSAAFGQLQHLRWKVTCAGGPTGHRFSYMFSSLLQPIGRDYLFLLLKAGFVDYAFALAEQVHARSMVDWMARSHYTNRLVRDNRLKGSINAVIPAGLSEMQRAASHIGAPLLVYMQVQSGYAVWLQRIDGTLISELISDPERLVLQVLNALPYSRRVRGDGSAEASPRTALADVYESGSIYELNERLSLLHTALIPPAIATALQQEGERLVIITDALLEYVPFCALRDEHGHYLIEHYELIYWPSVTAWLLTETDNAYRREIPSVLRERLMEYRFSSSMQSAPDTTYPPAIVLGDPQLKPFYQVHQSSEGIKEVRFAPLSGARREAEAVGQLLGVTPLLGMAATEEAMFAAANVIPIVHLATHGYLNTDYPEESFVVFSDSELQAGTLYQMEPGVVANLVMMSACNTGLGSLHPDSLIGLTNAFLIAGANTVGSTLWRIDDERTTTLIISFYSGLKANQNVAAALRTAQLDFIHQPELRHPKFWAAFKLTGNNANPLL